MARNIDADVALIERLGGAASLARQLDAKAKDPDDRYDVQRVQNWKTRGIPAEVRLKFPELFLSRPKWDGKDRRKATAA